MFVIDPESGAIVDANSAAAAYYGWSRDELITKKIAAINTLSAEQIQAEMQVARDAHGGNFNFKHRRPIARSARWRSSARPSEWPAAPCFTHSYSTSRTVGERTNASGGSTARWPC